MDMLVLTAAGVLGALLAAALGWWAGRQRGVRLLRETQAEAAALGERLAAREREVAALRVKREQQISDLLEQVRLAESQRKILSSQVAALRVERTDLESALAAERAATHDKLTLLTEAAQKLESAFKALASEAFHLGQQSQELDALTRPLKEALEAYDQQVRRTEEQRAEAYAAIRQHLDAVTGIQARLQTDSGNFVRALLHDRLAKLAEHFEELRRSLEGRVLAER